MTRPRPKAAAAVTGFGLFKSLTGADGAGADRTAAAVLTYPVRDADRDTVKPDGGDWDARPYVDFDHGCPIGTGEVVMREVPGPAGAPVVVPVGTATFARTRDDLCGVKLNGYPLGECLDTAGNVWDFVRAGDMDGVSIEFTPLPGGARRNGAWSPVNDRPSYDFTLWKGHGWAITPQPVNPHARLFTDGVSESLRRVAETGRLPGGTRATRTVMKSLSRLARPGRPAFVAGHTPAPEAAVPNPADEYDDEDTYDLPEADDEAPAEDAPGGDAAPEGDAPADAPAQLGPNATAGMQAVENIRGLAQQLEAQAADANIEVPGLREKLAEVAEVLHGHADDTHDHVAGLFPDKGLERIEAGEGDDADPESPDGDEGEGDDEEGDESESEGDGEDDDTPVKTKSFRGGVPGVVRFALADAKPVRKAAPDAEVARLKKSLAAKDKALTAALKQLDAMNRTLAPLVGRRDR